MTKLNICRLAVIVALLCFGKSYCFGQEGYSLSVFKDSDRKLDIDDLSSIKFEKIEKLNLGYTKEVVWVKVVLSDQVEVSNKLLYFTKSMHDSLSIYYRLNQSWKSVTTGVGTLDTLFAYHSGYYIPFGDINDSREFYIKSKSVYTQDLNFEIVDIAQKLSNELKIRILFGVITGAISVIILYNLFLGVSIRDATYFYYALTGIASLASQLTLMGIFNGNGVVSSIDIKEFFIPLNVTALNILGGIFCIKFLELVVYSRRARGIMIVGVCFNILQLILCYVLNKWGWFTPYKFVSIGGLIFGITSVYAGFAAVKGGNKNAKFYLIAWGLFLLSIVMLAFKVLGIIPSNSFTNNFFWMASIVEILLLSLALAARYKRWQIARYEAEKKLEFQRMDMERISQDNLHRLAFKNDLIESLQKAINSGDVQRSLKSLILDYNLQVATEKKHDQLNSKVEEVNAAFKEKLKASFPSLTSGEVEICGFIVTELSDQEIAIYRQTTPGAIKSARYRIRKKMKLKQNQKIQDVLKSISRSALHDEDKEV